MFRTRLHNDVFSENIVVSVHLCENGICTAWKWNNRHTLRGSEDGHMYYSIPEGFCGLVCTVSKRSRPHGELFEKNDWKRNRMLKWCKLSPKEWEFHSLMGISLMAILVDIFLSRYRRHCFHLVLSFTPREYSVNQETPCRINDNEISLTSFRLCAHLFVQIKCNYSHIWNQTVQD